MLAMIELTTNVAGIVWLSSGYIPHLARDGFFARLTLAPDGLGGGACEVVDGLHGVCSCSSYVYLFTRMQCFLECGIE